MTTTAAWPTAHMDGAHALLADGTPVRIRSARAADREAVLRMYREMSPEHLRMRFLGAGNRVTERSAERICADDRPGDRALVVLRGEQVLGAAEFHRNEPGGDTADVGIAVAGDWHRRGVGTLLMEHLVPLARRDGVRALTADALAANGPLFRLVADLGLRTTIRCADAEMHCTIELSAVDEPLPRPRSVVVIGTGRRPDSADRAILRRIREHGFTGELYAVGKRDPLPAGADLAVLVIAAHAVPEAAERCGKQGIRALIAVSSRLTDAQGVALQEICRGYGMRLVGPNCLGLSPGTARGTSLLDALPAAYRRLQLCLAGRHLRRQQRQRQ
ncbi:GNAT family N-acetyltransferase [Streptomyces gobiensis]|uniref:GNAT family N-acetyltransferase n=1 Tax=Streptomyces gobiensis TaxID=2875706 RepID=UPI001E49CB7A|nr:GNAT family N-acetyltransferase [Streptomyces gobiensis]UGY92278.1 GNAT family N-acetyltransferase [Streptomyces gobiensis]